jgi:hypothetical protein
MCEKKCVKNAILFYRQEILRNCLRMSNTNHTAARSITTIEAELRAATAKRASFRRVNNECGGGYIDETEIEALTAELRAAQSAASPLATREGIQAQREWAKSQNWTGADLAAANAACLARGFSLSDLQAAIKSL